MGLKLGQKLNFRPFSSFYSISGRDIKSGRDACRDIKSGRDAFRDIKSGRDAFRDIKSGRDACRDILPGHDACRTYFPDSNYFSSPTCRAHNFFFLTRIWACEYSLEKYLMFQMVQKN